MPVQVSTFDVSLEYNANDAAQTSFALALDSAPHAQSKGVDIAIEKLIENGELRLKDNRYEHVVPPAFSEGLRGLDQQNLIVNYKLIFEIDPKTKKLSFTVTPIYKLGDKELTLNGPYISQKYEVSPVNPPNQQLANLETFIAAKKNGFAFATELKTMLEGLTDPNDLYWALDAALTELNDEYFSSFRKKELKKVLGAMKSNLAKESRLAPQSTRSVDVKVKLIGKGASQDKHQQYESLFLETKILKPISDFFKNKKNDSLSEAGKLQQAIKDKLAAEATKPAGTKLDLTVYFELLSAKYVELSSQVFGAYRHSSLLNKIERIQHSFLSSTGQDRDLYELLFRLQKYESAKKISGPRERLIKKIKETVFSIIRQINQPNSNQPHTRLTLLMQLRELRETIVENKSQLRELIDNYIHQFQVQAQNSLAEAMGGEFFSESTNSADKPRSSLSIDKKNPYHSIAPFNEFKFQTVDQLNLMLGNSVMKYDQETRFTRLNALLKTLLARLRAPEASDNQRKFYQAQIGRIFNSVKPENEMQRIVSVLTSYKDKRKINKSRKNKIDALLKKLLNIYDPNSKTKKANTKMLDDYFNAIDSEIQELQNHWFSDLRFGDLIDTLYSLDQYRSPPVTHQTIDKINQEVELLAEAHEILAQFDHALESDAAIQNRFITAIDLAKKTNPESQSLARLVVHATKLLNNYATHGQNPFTNLKVVDFITSGFFALAAERLAKTDNFKKLAVAVEKAARRSANESASEVALETYKKFEDFVAKPMRDVEVLKLRNNSITHADEAESDRIRAAKAEITSLANELCDELKTTVINVVERDAGSTVSVSNAITAADAASTSSSASTSTVYVNTSSTHQNIKTISGAIDTAAQMFPEETPSKWNQIRSLLARKLLEGHIANPKSDLTWFDENLKSKNAPFNNYVISNFTLGEFDDALMLKHHNAAQSAGVIRASEFVFMDLCFQSIEKKLAIFVSGSSATDKSKEETRVAIEELISGYVMAGYIASEPDYNGQPFTHVERQIKYQTLDQSLQSLLTSLRKNIFSVRCEQYLAKNEFTSFEKYYSSSPLATLLNKIHRQDQNRLPGDLHDELQAEASKLGTVGFSLVTRPESSNTYQSVPKMDALAAIKRRITSLANAKTADSEREYVNLFYDKSLFEFRSQVGDYMRATFATASPFYDNLEKKFFNFCEMNDEELFRQINHEFVLDVYAKLSQKQLLKFGALLDAFKYFSSSDAIFIELDSLNAMADVKFSEFCSTNKIDQSIFSEFPSITDFSCTKIAALISKARRSERFHTEAICALSDSLKALSEHAKTRKCVVDEFTTGTREQRNELANTTERVESVFEKCCIALKSLNVMSTSLSARLESDLKRDADITKSNSATRITEAVRNKENQLKIYDQEREKALTKRKADIAATKRNVETFRNEKYALFIALLRESTPEQNSQEETEIRSLITANQTVITASEVKLAALVEAETNAKDQRDIFKKKIEVAECDECERLFTVLQKIILSPDSKISQEKKRTVIQQHAPLFDPNLTPNSHSPFLSEAHLCAQYIQDIFTLCNDINNKKEHTVNFSALDPEKLRLIAHWLDDDYKVHLVTQSETQNEALIATKTRMDLVAKLNSVAPSADKVSKVSDAESVVAQSVVRKYFAELAQQFASKVVNPGAPASVISSPTVSVSSNSAVITSLEPRYQLIAQQLASKVVIPRAAQLVVSFPTNTVRSHHAFGTLEIRYALQQRSENKKAVFDIVAMELCTAPVSVDRCIALLIAMKGLVSDDDLKLFSSLYNVRFEMAVKSKGHNLEALKAIIAKIRDKEGYADEQFAAQLEHHLILTIKPNAKTISPTKPKPECSATVTDEDRARNRKITNLDKLFAQECSLERLTEAVDDFEKLKAAELNSGYSSDVVKVLINGIATVLNSNTAENIETKRKALAKRVWDHCATYSDNFKRLHASKLLQTPEMYDNNFAKFCAASRFLSTSDTSPLLISKFQEIVETTLPNLLALGDKKHKTFLLNRINAFTYFFLRRAVSDNALFVVSIDNDNRIGTAATLVPYQTFFATLGTIVTNDENLNPSCVVTVSKEEAKQKTTEMEYVDAAFFECWLLSDELATELLTALRCYMKNAGKDPDSIQKETALIQNFQSVAELDDFVRRKTLLEHHAASQYVGPIVKILRALTSSEIIGRDTKATYSNLYSHVRNLHRVISENALPDSEFNEHVPFTNPAIKQTFQSIKRALRSLETRLEFAKSSTQRRITVSEVEELQPQEIADELFSRCFDESAAQTGENFTIFDRGMASLIEDGLVPTAAFKQKLITRANEMAAARATGDNVAASTSSSSGQSAAHVETDFFSNNHEYPTLRQLLAEDSAVSAQLAQSNAGYELAPFVERLLSALLGKTTDKKAEVLLTELDAFEARDFTCLPSAFSNSRLLFDQIEREVDMSNFKKDFLKLFKQIVESFTKADGEPIKKVTSLKSITLAYAFISQLEFQIQNPDFLSTPSLLELDSVVVSDDLPDFLRDRAVNTWTGLLDLLDRSNPTMRFKVRSYLHHSDPQEQLKVTNEQVLRSTFSALGRNDLISKLDSVVNGNALMDDIASINDAKTSGCITDESAVKALISKCNSPEFSNRIAGASSIATTALKKASAEYVAAVRAHFESVAQGKKVYVRNDIQLMRWLKTAEHLHNALNPDNQINLFSEIVDAAHHQFVAIMKTLPKSEDMQNAATTCYVNFRDLINTNGGDAKDELGWVDATPAQRLSRISAVAELLINAPTVTRTTSYFSAASYSINGNKADKESKYAAHFLESIRRNVTDEKNAKSECFINGTLALFPAQYKCLETFAHRIAPEAGSQIEKEIETKFISLIEKFRDSYAAVQKADPNNELLKTYSPEKLVLTINKHVKVETVAEKATGLLKPQDHTAKNLATALATQ